MVTNNQSDAFDPTIIEREILTEAVKVGLTSGTTMTVNLSFYYRYTTVN